VRLPAEYPQRDALYEEIHARPSDPVVAPLQVSYLAMLSAPPAAEAEREHVASLARRYGAVPPPAGTNHFSARFDTGDGAEAFQLKWERHTEFARYTVMAPGVDDSSTALARLPEDWVAALAGELIVAVHCTVREGADELGHETEQLTRFSDGGYVGTRLAGGAVSLYTDFMVGADRFSHYLAFDHGTTPYQLGRVIQRLLEIHTYWLLALRGLPVARSLGPYLDERETALRRVNQSLTVDHDAEEAEVLSELIRLEAEISDRASDNAYRFGASRAYYGLVQQRLKELRERYRRVRAELRDLEMAGRALAAHEN